MKKTTILSLAVLLVLLPGALYLGTQLSGRAYYLTGTLVLILLMIPFFLAFEGRRPKAREIVLIAVMCALAIASRGALAFLPHIKPIFGIILISGAVFGWQTGFLIGAISAFGSNFFFGQGPWTPWQMVAYGVVGLFGGLLGKRCNALMLALLGFFVTVLVAGPLLDLSRLFTTATVFSKTAVISTFAMGVPVNLLNAAGTFVTVLLLKKPLVERLQRVREKYGMI